ncbi:MAG: hypothetical protein UR60_C0010G0027 [Candidatus Moranbacteria bacterium GW2011_GWF2_34_56]|nr:MAG: hypothetical protein UR51_C0001G0049 [Candidatus Moranbacteria bacterium GW2011_GWF1_34_10]KKP65038.1 MAG: hypothetical protein UR60_C0010G0027 [Candidatus Moranbacteria bacterium GW2011_GWF2_34_56]HBI16946.1 hypothetical protein [Candidatus Moranbacteria bacterium]
MTCYLNYYLIVVRTEETGKLSSRIINTEGNTIEQLAQYYKSDCGEEIIRYYPLEDSLMPIGKLVEDSKYGKGHYLGGQLEELLTNLAQNLFDDGFKGAEGFYGIQPEKG